MIREHPIIFSGEMIEAILDGRKNVTRRVVKPQPEKIEIRDIGEGCQEVIWKDSKRLLSIGGGGNVLQVVINKLCPYGQIGSKLWVRETWLKGTDNEIYYLANCNELEYAEEVSRHTPGVKVRWKPSIFMLRSASRITLEITNIKVERLQEIGIEDVHKEGIERWRDYEGGEHLSVVTTKNTFIRFWDSFNGKKYSWRDNPFVWIIEFKKI